MKHLMKRLAIAFGVVIVLLAGVVFYGAEVYRPKPPGGYRPPARWMTGSRTVDTAVARFHYVERGAGSPVVLLPPGSIWTFAWNQQVEVLARRHTVYVVDLPGQGFTELHDGHFHWNLAGMTGALGSFLDAVGVRRTALAGNSWGGGIALAYAQRYPERVDKLALLDASGLAKPDVWSWEILKYPIIGELAVNLFSGKSSVRSTVRALFGHKNLATGQLVEAIWAVGLRSDNLEANYRLERGLDWNETQRAMPSTRQPTLVIWGGRDTVLQASHAKEFGSRLPHAQVHVLPDCGHVVMLDCPQLVNPLLEGFFG